MLVLCFSVQPLDGLTMTSIIVAGLRHSCPPSSFAILSFPLQNTQPSPIPPTQQQHHTPRPAFLGCCVRASNTWNCPSRHVTLNLFIAMSLRSNCKPHTPFFTLVSHRTCNTTFEQTNVRHQSKGLPTHGHERTHRALKKDNVQKHKQKPNIYSLNLFKKTDLCVILMYTSIFLFGC